MDDGTLSLSSWGSSSPCSSGTGCRSTSSRSSPPWRCGPPACWTTAALAGLRRPGGDLHRHAVRGQRGHRLHRRDRLGGPEVADAGRDRARLLVAVCLLSAVLTALITLNGAVAALLPLVVMLAIRIGQPPSQMLMPLAFAGSAGGC